MAMDAQEQLLLELVNRTRLDPEAEALRLGIGLNDGLPPGTLDGTARQVLAPNTLLEQAATDHSVWMLDADTFDHIGAGGSTPGSRATAAGYIWTAVGENIATRYGTTLEDAETAIRNMHDSLFLSAGHRENLLDGLYQEIGLGQESGLYTPPGGIEYQGWMLTELFGSRTSDVFLTGVAYDDTDGDAFYSPGEGLSGVSFTIGATSAITAGAGGYALQVTPGAAVAVTGTHAGGSFAVTVDFSGGNVKLDLVDGTRLLGSGSLTLISGIAAATLLGRADLDLTGNAASNLLEGNGGANRLTAGTGNDTLNGGAGADTLDGGTGNDTYRVDSYGDQVLEYAGGGTDTVETALTNYSIFSKPELENLTGTAASAQSLTGNGGANRLTAGAGNDTLNGGAGADTLDGGSGIDRMTGGTGNDTYRVDSYGDQVLEYAGGGTDTVETALTSYSIFSKPELENLTGTAAYGGPGTGQTLTGNIRNNILRGGQGYDLLNGSAGNDTLSGGRAGDTLTGGSGSDAFLFDTELGGNNVETITDFAPGVDVILLPHAIFSTAGAIGVLEPDRFVIGQVATTSTQRIIYDPVRGSLFYDPDGSGGTPANWIARMSNGPALSASDFLLV